MKHASECVKSKKHMQLHPDADNNPKSLAEIDLGMAGRMCERDKSLAGSGAGGPHLIFHRNTSNSAGVAGSFLLNRFCIGDLEELHRLLLRSVDITASIALFEPQTLVNPFRGMPLFCRGGLVRIENGVDDRN
jgi:hypothetical protein